MTVFIVVGSLLVGAKYGWPYGAVLAVACWVAHSWAWPLTDCFWCKSKSKRRNKGGDGAVFHMCLVCDGSGRRRRFLTAITGRGLGKI